MLFKSNKNQSPYTCISPRGMYVHYYTMAQQGYGIKESKTCVLARGHGSTALKLGVG